MADIATVPVDEQWEYLRLAYIVSEASKGSPVFIAYYRSDGEAIIQEAGPVNMFRDSFGRAIGKLGAIGWEMVSAQHADFDGEIKANNIVIYFKRRVAPGRAINDPPLNLT